MIIIKLMNTEGLINQVNLLNTYVRALESEKSSIQLENQRLHRQIQNLAKNQEQLVHELKLLKSQNQDLFHGYINKNEQLRKMAQIQRVLFEKQQELILGIQEKNRLQQLIIKKEQKIKQFQSKVKGFEQAFDRQRRYLNQTVQESNLKDKLIAQISSELQNKVFELSKSNMELVKKQYQFSEQIKCLSKNINQLNERYCEVVKINQTHQSKVLALQKNNAELQALLFEEKALLNQYKMTQTSLFEKGQTYTISIKKLESELSQLAKLRSEENQRFIRRIGEMQQEKEEAIKEKEEFNKKCRLLQNQKQLAAKQNSQKSILIHQLQKKRNQENLQLSQLKQQSKRKQELLKQKIKALQQQLLATENQVNSAKFTAMLDYQTKSQKETQLNTLKKVISEQQKYIVQQKAGFSKISDLLSSKENEIQSLQASNSTLRKQLLATLANEDSSRKEMLPQKQNSTALLRKSPASQSNLMQYKRKSHLAGKRLTIVSQHTAEAGLQRSALSKFTYLESKNTSQSLVMEMMAPADESDCEEL